MMIKVIFILKGKSFSYQFLASWTKLLQECPDYGVDWQTVFDTLGDKVKTKYDYLMWIDQNSVFEPEQFKALLEKMKNNPQIGVLAARSLKKGSSNLGFTLIRKGVTDLQPLVDPEVVIGYEKTVIWR